jgi:hypothetical protein
MPPILKLVASRFWETFLNVFTTRTTLEFDRFRSSPLGAQSTSGDQAPPITNVVPLELDANEHGDPAATEEAFTQSVSEGRFDAAWELLNPDSQASWDGKEHFAREMAARQPTKNLLGTTVRQVRLLPIWTDHASRKTYHQVAELVVDYRVRQRQREMLVTRDVHLVNVAGAWKSLCYRT